MGLGLIIEFVLVLAAVVMLNLFYIVSIRPTACKFSHYAATACTGDLLQIKLLRPRS